MADIEYFTGETEVWEIVPRDPSGAATGASYLAAQLRISAPGECRILEGVSGSFDDGSGPAAGFAFTFDDASMTGLPPSLYRASLWMQDAQGWRRVGNLTISVGGDC